MGDEWWTESYTQSEIQTKSLEITLEAQNSALLSVRIQLSNSTSVRMRGLPLEITIPIPIDDKDEEYRLTRNPQRRHPLRNRW